MVRLQFGDKWLKYISRRNGSTIWFKDENISRRNGWTIFKPARKTRKIPSEC